MKTGIRHFSLGVFLSLATLCWSPTSFAGVQTGVITQIMVRASDDLHYFYMSNEATGRPACGTGTYWMIRDENSATGKHKFAMLLAAYAAGSQVTITGTDTCTRWANGEDVNMVRVR